MIGANTKHSTSKSGSWPQPPHRSNKASVITLNYYGAIVYKCALLLELLLYSFRYCTSLLRTPIDSGSLAFSVAASVISTSDRSEKEY